MSNNLKIKPNVERLFHYIEELKRGKIQVPAFQRDFIWDNKKKLELLDSIKLGYPIGSVLLWQPNIAMGKETYSFQAEKIGSYKIPEPSQEFFYILDGYQRLSTLFGCLINPLKKELERDDEDWKKNFNILYNLESNEFEMNRKTHFEDLEIYQVPIYRLIDAKEFFIFQKKLYQSKISPSKIDDYIEKYEQISLIFQTYELPSINIIGGTMDKAVEIFSRLNSKGAPISADWIVSALAFSQNKGFRLGTEIDTLLDNLKTYNFQGLKRELILQCITNAFDKVFFDQSKPKQLEDLAKREDFKSVTMNALKNIEKTIHFLFEELLVLDSNLLPYNSQLIFIAYFFYKLPEPTENQLIILKKWFWVTSYAGYFTMYNLSRQRKAYDKFIAFIEGTDDDPIYVDKPSSKFTVAEFPTKINFGAVRATSLALFMLHYLNKFKTIQEADVAGYKTYYLFSDILSKEEKFVSENTILWIDWYYSDAQPHYSHLNIPKKAKDLSFWLHSDENHDLFFITKEMKDKYRKGASKIELLQLRKKLILKAEKGFVESLGLEY